MWIVEGAVTGGLIGWLLGLGGYHLDSAMFWAVMLGWAFVRTLCRAAEDYA